LEWRQARPAVEHAWTSLDEARRRNLPDAAL
jgi:hypothetical protein